MSWKQTITLAQLQQQGRHCETIDNHKILLIWHNDKVHAIASQCPHLKLPLTKGKIIDNNSIICPFHKSAFNLTTGTPECWSPWPPAIGTLLGKISKPKNLKIYPVKIEDEIIQVDVA